MIGLVFIGMSSLAWISYSYSKEALEKTTEEKIMSITDATVKLTDMWIESVKQNIVSWSDQEALQSATIDNFYGKSVRVTVNEQFPRLINEHPYLEVISLIDKKGICVASSDVQAIGKTNTSDKDFFQEAMKGHVLDDPPLTTGFKIVDFMVLPT